MKIKQVRSHGGHLTELMLLSEAFESDKRFYISYDTQRTRELGAKTYSVQNIKKGPLLVLINFFRVTLLFSTERPDVILSTGAEIAVPAFYAVKSRCMTGRIVYLVTGRFLVQWPEFTDLNGDDARYEGSVV